MITIQREAYTTDLQDKEWQYYEALLPVAAGVGRPLEWPLREILNAIFYILRSGCAWRLLPHDLPPWQSVYYHFRKWKRDGTWEQINQQVRETLRSNAGKEKTPSAAILDSQSVKTTAVKGVRGYDAGKKIKGRKRNIIVDTLGCVLLALVSPANVQDRDGAKQLLTRLKEQLDLPRLKLIWADGGYRGKLVDWVQGTFQWVLEIVKRNDDVKGFVVLPKRWIVERTFGWLNGYRRLSKDYEELVETSEAYIYIAMTHLMVRRLAGCQSFNWDT